jgi:hypothetical protein
MTIVSRLQLDHPALDDPGGNALHTQVEDLYIKIGDNLSARYFEVIGLANSGTTTLTHNFKMPFDELAFKIYALAGAGGELTVTDEDQYDIVANGGNPTTQIDVTNNTGGVSTFAVLMQSIGGTGGGQNSYSIVVDAAGGGDYLTIKEGIEAATAGQSVYIRNGAYTESTTISIASGISIIGESRDGVVLTNSNTGTDGCFQLPSGQHELSRSTYRLGNNKDWDITQGCGTGSIAANGTIVTYNGPNDPSIGYFTTLGNDPKLYEIIAVDGGLNQFTIDTPWPKGAESDLPFLMFSSLPGGADARTVIENMTIIQSSTSTNGRVFDTTNGAHNLFVKNCHFEVNAGATTSVGKIIYAGSMIFNCNFDDCRFEQNNPGTGVHAPFYSTFGMQNLNLTKCQMVGFQEMPTASFTWFNDWHLTHLGLNESTFIRAQTSNIFDYGSFIVDVLTGGAGANMLITPQAKDTFVGNIIRVGQAKGDVNAFGRGAQNLCSFGHWDSTGDIGMSVYTITTADKDINTLTDTISNTAGDIYAHNSVMSDTFLVTETNAIDGTPLRDNRAEATGGQLYDVIVDAAGGFDFTSLDTAISSSPNGTTIFVKNGTYATSEMDLKPGQKIIGESMNGVVITDTASIVFDVQQMFSGVRGQTNRTNDNLDWDDTQSIGTISMVLSSTIGTYTGPVDPQIGDVAIIGDGSMFEIVATNPGSNQVTFDREWKGKSSVAMDWYVFSGAIADWEDYQSTEVSNLTIYATNTANRVFDLIRFSGFKASNIRVYSSSNNNSVGYIEAISTWNSEWHNCEFYNVGTGNGQQGWDFSLGCGNIKFRGITMEGGYQNFMTGASTSPLKYFDWEFDSIRFAGAGLFLFNHRYQCFGKFNWGKVIGLTEFTQSETQVAWYGCDHRFDYVDTALGASGRLTISGAKTNVSIGRCFSGDVSVIYGSAITAFAPGNEMVVRDSYLVGVDSFTVNDGTIITDSVVHPGYAGAPAWDNSYDYNNPPGASTASPPLYDIVVDSSGAGDYTTIYDGLLAAVAGQTIYVRNGTYTETSLPILKNGCTLIGESRSGVIIQETGHGNVLTIGNGNNYGSNARTQLNTNRDDWDAASGLGTVSCTNNSATVSYTGPSLPAAGGFLQIGSHDPVEILSVSAPNITLVNNWTGPTLSGVDANYFTGFVNSITRIENVTIEAIGNQAGLYHQWSIYGVEYKNCSFTTTATSISYPCLSFNGNVSNVIIDDCSFKSLQTSGTTQTCVIRINIAAQNITFKDCYSENLSDNYFNGSATNVQKYMNWHFKRITGASDEVFQQLNCVHSSFHVEEMDNCFGWWSRNFTTWEPQLKCNFKFGTVTNMGSGQFDIIGKLNVIDVGFLDGPLEVQAQSATGTFRNIITTGLVNGFLSVDDSVVIGGGVAYDSIGGAPASNNGHEF